MTAPSHVRRAAAGAVAILAVGCARGPTSPETPAVEAVSVAPAADTIPVGGTSMLTATAFDARGRAIPGVRFLWSSSDPVVAHVDTLGVVRAFQEGTAEVTASAGGRRGTAVVVVEAAGPPPGEPIEELRALWVTRWDWRSAADIAALFDGAARAGFNAVYFQVRGVADALYASALEPWSALLTGSLGVHPGWDPLAVAAAEATARGLELHAWLNAFTGWLGASPPPVTTPPHAFVEHPEWVMVDRSGQPMPYGSGYRWLTPGEPGVRTRLARVAADVARRYPIRGVHLDLVRYPDTLHSYDAASLAAYEAARASEPALGFDEFRRRLVTEAVRETADSLRAARPDAILSAAVWGVYRNERGWSGVSTGYDDRLQDARVWATLGLVDALVPMVYWPIQSAYGSRLDFAYLADEHAGAVAARHVYIGISAEAIDFAELARQIERARTAGAEGVAVFQAAILRERDYWSRLAAGPFRRPATPPPMPWKPGATYVTLRAGPR